jgi:hypothetical protein
MSEQEKAILDAATYGIGVLVDNKHVPYKDTLPETITLPIAEYEAMRLDAERWNYFIETCSEEVAFYITGNGNADKDEINKSIDERRAIKEGN